MFSRHVFVDKYLTLDHMQLHLWTSTTFDCISDHEAQDFASLIANQMSCKPCSVAHQRHIAAVKLQLSYQYHARRPEQLIMFP